MAGARIEITQDTATPAVANAITSLQGDGLRLMLDDIGEYLMRATRERAEREVSPEGVPWAALSPRYKRYKDRKRPGVPKLKFDFHMLGDMFARQVIGNNLYVGTNAPYGAIQHSGGEVKKPARTQELFFRQDRDGTVGNLFVPRKRSNFAQSAQVKEHTFTMPARPWLGLSNEDTEEVINIARDHLAGMFSGE